MRILFFDIDYYCGDAVVLNVPLDTCSATISNGKARIDSSVVVKEWPSSPFTIDDMVADPTWAKWSFTVGEYLKDLFDCELEHDKVSERILLKRAEALGVHFDAYCDICG